MSLLMFLLTVVLAVSPALAQYSPYSSLSREQLERRIEDFEQQNEYLRRAQQYPPYRPQVSPPYNPDLGRLNSQLWQLQQLERTLKSFGK